MSQFIVSKFIDPIAFSFSLWAVGLLFILREFYPLQSINIFVFGTGAILAAAHQLSPLLLYCNLSLYRKILSPKFFLVLGGSLVLILGISYFAFSYNDEEISWGIFLFLGLVLAWESAKHLAGQNYGILSLLTTNNDLTQRRWDRRYVNLFNLILLPISNVFKGREYGELLPYLDFLNYFELFWPITFLSTGIFAITVLRDHHHQNLNWNRLTFLATITFQPIIVMKLSLLYSYVFISFGHWIMDIYLAAKIHSIRAKVFHLKRYIFFLIFVILVGYFYRHIQNNSDIRTLAQIQASRIQLPTFDELSLYKTFLFGLGTWFIGSHLYLSRYIYGHEAVRQELKISQVLDNPNQSN